MNNFIDDTIAAISTSTMTSGGISVIRISGPRAIEIADSIFKSKKNIKLSDVESHTVHYGNICSVSSGEIIDEVLSIVMKAPNTYTREDVVEIDCHGGILVTRKVLEEVVNAGARIAEPGEFTKRAFLNGRMDLSQAEAVIDVINSKNEYALKSSVSQLRGNVQKKIQRIREEILYHTAFIETALDDPEHISVDGYGEKLKITVDSLLDELKDLLDNSDNGRMIKEGIKTVIVGKPNAGKSSLLNVLLGEERAIVTDIEGTTRDVLEETVQLSGISLQLIDTAGIRNTEDIVEKIGVDKAKTYAEDADVIIYVVDASRELDDNDKNIIEMIGNKKAIVLLNKSDLDTVITKEMMISYLDKPMIEISAKEESGIRELEDMLKKMFFSGEISFNDEVYITNIRHKNAISEAYQSLLKVNISIENNMPEDFYSIDLLDAYESLGNITGETMGEDLVNEIFSKFCMGK